MSDRKAKVPPDIQAMIVADINAAAEQKDLLSLRSFADEAEASGMASEAARAREVGSLIEAWLAKENRAELLRIKSAMKPPARPRLNVAALVRAHDQEGMDAGAPFDRDTFEDVERRRVTETNRQLAERDRRLEEQRAR